MTLLGLKLFFGKMWSFLKTYWWVPVGVIILIVLWILLRRKPESLAGALRNAIESHKREVDSLERIHADEIEKREKALEEHDKKVEEVNKKFEEANIELDKKKKKQIEKIVKENKDSPDKIAKQIADTWGFELK